jgi:salicylate hydroxylase
VLEASRVAGLVSQVVAPGFEEVKEGDETVSDEKLQALIEDLSRQWEWTEHRSALALLQSELLDDIR